MCSLFKDFLLEYNYPMNVLRKIKAWIKKLPDRKNHLDFIAAVLSIPVLLTVVTLNLMNLSDKNKSKKEEAEKPIIVQTVENKVEKTPVPTEKPESTTSKEPCKKDVGPISISYPKEGDKVVDNPVCFIIKYEDPNYCSVVWSYRINLGNWSEYSGNSVCLYDVPPGDVKFDLRVQSTASNDQESLTRNFTSDRKVTLTPSPEATPSSILR